MALVRWLVLLTLLAVPASAQIVDPSAPGVAFSAGGVAIPVCRIDGTAGVGKQIRGVGTPPGICGTATHGVLVAVVDAIGKSDCSAGGSNQVTLCQYDANIGGTNKWTPAGAGTGSGAPEDATYITKTANGVLSAEQALSTLSTGIMQVTTSTGAVTSLPIPLGIANGGTNLMAAADDNIMVGNSTTWQTKGLPTTGTSGCSGSGDKLLYRNSDNTFLCGVDSGGTPAAGSVTNATVATDAAIAGTKLANTPNGAGIEAVTVQAAINELDTDKLGVTDAIMSDLVQAQVYSPDTSDNWTSWGAEYYGTLKLALDSLANAVRAIWAVTYGQYNVAVDLTNSTVWSGLTRTTYTGSHGGNPCKALQAGLKVAWTGKTTVPNYESSTHGPSFRMKVVGSASAYSAEWRQAAADEFRVCFSLFDSRTWADNTGATTARPKVTVGTATFQFSDVGKPITWSSGGTGTIVGVDRPTVILYSITTGSAMTTGNTVSCTTCAVGVNTAATSAYTYGWAATTAGDWPVPDTEGVRYSRALFIDFEDAYLYVYNDSPSRAVILELGNGYEYGAGSGSSIRTSFTDQPNFYGGQNQQVKIRGEFRYQNATASSVEPYTYATGTPVGLPLATRSPVGTLIGMFQTNASNIDMSQFSFAGYSQVDDNDDIGYLRMNSGWTTLQALRIVTGGGAGLMLYGYNQGGIESLHIQGPLRGIMAGDPYNSGAPVFSKQCRMGSRLTVAGASFVASDVGKALTWTGGGNGVIQSVVSGTQIDYRITDLADTYVAATDTLSCNGSPACNSSFSGAAVTLAGTYCGKAGAFLGNAGGFVVSHAQSLEGGVWGNYISYGSGIVTIKNAWLEMTGENGSRTPGHFEDMAPSILLGAGAVVDTNGAGSWAPCYAYAKHGYTCIPPPYFDDLYRAHNLGYGITNYANGAISHLELKSQTLGQKMPNATDDTVLDHTGVSRSLSTPAIAIGPGGQKWNGNSNTTSWEKSTITGYMTGSDVDETTNTASGSAIACYTASGIDCALFLAHPAADMQLDLTQSSWGLSGSKYAVTVTASNAFVTADVGKTITWTGGGTGQIKALSGTSPTSTVFYWMQAATVLPIKVGDSVSCASDQCATQLSSSAATAAYNATPFTNAGIKVDITKTGSAYNVRATPTLNTDVDNFYPHVLYDGDETECQNVDAASIDAGITNVPLFSSLGTERLALFVGCRCVSGTCTTPEVVTVKNANGLGMRMPTLATCAKNQEQIVWRSVRSRNWIQPGDTILADGSTGASPTAGVTQICLRSIQAH